ncbi:MAG: hypothetical protein SFU86_24365 [Pirellulaceae bacterium]|nr:hypothetical protein [Pirellulaceae bacterium]
MKLLVNYGNEYFRESQAKNSATGREVGGFDEVASFGPDDIDADFRAKHKQTLSHFRGNGYWLWKPYFIYRTLADLASGDFLFYCDSGAYFTAAIDPLVEVCLRDRQDVIPFDNRLPEKTWTKRDAFVLLDCDRPEITDTTQRLASFTLIRKSPFSLAFVREWLIAAEDPRILTDLKNTQGLPNYPQFIDHRHDQSIFSLLTKKHGLAAYRNPSQNSKNFGAFPTSTYGTLIEHTRKRQLPLHLKLMREVQTGWMKLRKMLQGKPQFESGKRRRRRAA